jgi:hypothetical protein
MLGNADACREESWKPGPEITVPRLGKVAGIISVPNGRLGSSYPRNNLAPS